MSRPQPGSGGTCCLGPPTTINIRRASTPHRASHTHKHQQPHNDQHRPRVSPAGDHSPRALFHGSILALRTCPHQSPPECNQSKGAAEGGDRVPPERESRKISGDPRRQDSGTTGAQVIPGCQRLGRRKFPSSLMHTKPCTHRHSISHKHAMPIKATAIRRSSSCADS